MTVFNLKREVKLSYEQEEAVEQVIDLKTRIVSVTGGAGTGKTTILKHAHDELAKKNKTVLLAAPTGRAAKRIQEATGIPARTIHRLLEFPAPIDVEQSGGKIKFGEPRRNRSNPIPCDAIIVDEASMIASGLYRQLMEAIPTHASIRFFGDINQLPPIDNELPVGDSMFKRTLNERPCIYLSYNFRSDDNLIENANRILRGSIPQRGPKFEMLITNDPISTLRSVATNDFHDTLHQVITPKRKGQSGSASLSSILRTKFNLNFNSQRMELARFDDNESPLTIFTGDKVIWTKNDYVLNIMNGELGIVDGMDDGTISIIFDDNRHALIPPSIKGPFGNFYDPRKQIDLAYAMTTHKSQGSEFDSVIYLMTRSQAFLLNRNNFYTGVTRARHHVTVIADKYAISYAMRRAR